MKYLQTESWRGYSEKKGRENETAILSYTDKLTNSTQQRADKSIAGGVSLDSVTFTFEEDASVPAIKQKCVNLEEIPVMVFEDVKADKDGTIMRRLTLLKAVIIDVQVMINEQGDGLATVKLLCQAAKWERLTPDNKAYAEAMWNPNGLEFPTPKPKPK